MAIWQDLVSDLGFPHGYQTVKRFVRKLRGSESPQAVGIALAASSPPYPQMRAAKLEDQVASGTMNSAPKTGQKATT